MSKKKLQPVDLSFFTGWKFVAGVGNYNHKQACIMSALYLATKIAEGKVTLDEVLAPIPQTGPYNDPLSEQDRVTCVSPTLRQLLIERNDSFLSDDARTAWAVPMLPRVLGTMLGDKFEEKTRHELSQFRFSRISDDFMPDSERNKQSDEDIEFLIAIFDKEKAKRAAVNEKRRVALAAKKAGAGQG